MRPDDVRDALTWLIESNGPAFLEVVTDKKVSVLPMVPAGNALHEFLVYDGGTFLFPNPPFSNKPPLLTSCRQRQRTQKANG